MANYRLFAPVIGIPFTKCTSANSSTLNATATWYAVNFIAPVTSTLNSVRTYVTAKTGTLVAADSTINVFSNNAASNNVPNSSVAGPTSCDSAITAAGWYNWTPSYSVTMGTRYWIVWKNANGTPASNNYSLRYGSFQSQLANPLASLGTRNGDLISVSSTNSGTSWSNLEAGTMRLGFSDGSYWGFPYSNIASDNAVANRVYSTREHGVKFTLPANLNCKVIGVGLSVGGKGGTPTGTPRLRLYTGSSPSLQATADIDNINVGQIHYGYFSSAVTLTGGTVCRITLGETTNSDTSSNYFFNPLITCDSDSNSTGLIPYSTSKTYYDGSTWTETSNSFTPYFLILNDATEGFDAGGSSGGVLIPRTFSGF